MTNPHHDLARAYFAAVTAGDRIAWIAEHYNALIVQEKLVPLMARVG